MASRQPIKDISELDSKCVLKLGGTDFTWRCNDSYGHEFKSTYSTGYCFNDKEVLDFIRWGAITKPVEPRRWTGTVTASGYMRPHGLINVHFLPNDTMECLPYGTRVIVTEVLDGEGE